MALVRGATLLRAAVLTLAVGGAASAAYQRYGDARDQQRYPPPGELVDIGSRRLHLVRAGEGTPAVVIEPALGGTAAEWAYVQRDLADTTTAITYDRAGLGWSDPAPRWHRRTATLLADDLHRLLVAAAVPPPYLLVGHSMGGYLIRLYQARHPELVCGLVLADSSHLDQERRIARRLDLQDRRVRAVRLWLRPWGLHRLRIDRGLLQDAARSRAGQLLPPDLVDGDVAMGRSSRSLRADVAEMLGVGRMVAEVRVAVPVTAGGLGDLPLTVLTSSEVAPNLTGYWAEWRRRVYPTWTILQREMAALSTRSTHLVAEHAGHNLHHDDRDFVVSAIREHIERHRMAGTA